MTDSPHIDPEAEPAQFSPRPGHGATLADPALALSRARDFLNAATGSRDVYFQRGLNTHKQHRQYQARMRGLLPLIRDIAKRVHPVVVPDLEESRVDNDSGEPTWQWEGITAAVETLVGVLEYQDAHQQIPGAIGPMLAASGLHEWVWDAAKGRWDAEYYGDAVHAAAEVIVQKTKVKLGRRDLSGTRLYGTAFSSEAPRPGHPRLRFASVDPQDEEMWNSVHQGAMHLGMACAQGIRNPQAHKMSNQLTEQEALEQLGALSVLARWVDASVLDTEDCP